MVMSTTFDDAVHRQCPPRKKKLVRIHQQKCKNRINSRTLGLTVSLSILRILFGWHEIPLVVETDVHFWDPFGWFVSKSGLQDHMSGYWFYWLKAPISSASFEFATVQSNCCCNYQVMWAKNMSTLWLFNIAMENGPFIDGLPIRNGDFPWLC